MASIVNSFAISGIEGYLVEVETDTIYGQPSISQTAKSQAISLGYQVPSRTWNCVISNNIAENSIRPFTIGRKNWTFCGSPQGANASAFVYSLVETAKANGLNPYKYLEFFLSRLPGSNIKTNPKVLDLMMPWDELIQKTCKSE